jgi:hypothetical protein
VECYVYLGTDKQVLHVWLACYVHNLAKVRGLANVDRFTHCKASDKTLGMHCTWNRILTPMSCSILLMQG